MMTYFTLQIHSNGDLEVKRVTSRFHFVTGMLKCHAIGQDGHSVADKSTFVYINRVTIDDSSSESSL